MISLHTQTHTSQCSWIHSSLLYNQKNPSNLCARTQLPSTSLSLLFPSSPFMVQPNHSHLNICLHEQLSCKSPCKHTPPRKEPPEMTKHQESNIYIYIYINYFTAIFKGKRPRKLRKISILIGSSGIGQCSI